MKQKKENFIKRYGDVKQQVIDAIDHALKSALKHNAINFDEHEDNYIDVYPLIGAVLERELKYCLAGSVDANTNKWLQKKCREYLNNVVIWQRD